MAKRGRKPKNEERSGYWYEREEQAVLDYIAADTKEEKEKIYGEILRPAFEKLVESIIRRYHYFPPGEDYKTTYDDTLNMLFTKLDKFDPEEGKKAYSYYGTICRNYLISRLTKYTENLVRNPSLETMENDIIDNIKYADTVDKAREIAKDTIDTLSHKLDIMTENPQKYGLKPNEVKLGRALSNLLTNWDYVLSTDGSDKLNKSAVLLFLRESTGFDTKGIRDNIKKFKKEFLIIRNMVLNEEMLEY